MHVVPDGHTVVVVGSVVLEDVVDDVDVEDGLQVLPVGQMDVVV